MANKYIAEVELHTDQGRSFTAHCRAPHAPYALNYAMDKVYGYLYDDDESYGEVRRIRCKVDKL